MNGGSNAGNPEESLNKNCLCTNCKGFEQDEPGLVGQDVRHEYKLNKSVFTW